jgi:transcriptional regulator with XRE-family HTH domain
MYIHSGSVMYARRMRKANTATRASEDSGVDLNEIVAYNFRAARELRGWTQEETALRLEGLLGQRLPQASISAIERAYEGDRRREFDAHELLAFALAFELPLAWFFLPPPGDRRRLRHTSSQVNELYGIVFGRPEHLEPLHDRLRRLGIDHPTEADVAIEQITGARSAAREQSYRERRNAVLLDLLDRDASRLDKAADELGAFFDHLRRVGIRGFVAEHVHPDPVAEEITLNPGGRRSRAKQTQD